MYTKYMYQIYNTVSKASNKLEIISRINIVSACYMYIMLHVHVAN